MQVLFVCTGNICRSPLAEMLLQKSTRGLPIDVASSGTGALVGRGMPVENQEIAKGLGISDPTNHAARLLTTEQIHDADLVLALSRAHRRQIVELVPRASRYTFTLREFARIANSLTADDFASLNSSHPAERLREVIELVAQFRGSVPPTDPADDDVVDPYQQTFDVYAEQAEQLVPAVNAAARLFHNAVRSVNG